MSSLNPTNTAKLYFSFSSATRTNSIIYALKQIPLIKKLLPEHLYAAKGLKTFAQVLTVLSEPTRIFLGKFVYFAIIAFTAFAHRIVVEDNTQSFLPDCALAVFVLFTLAGGFFGSPLFVNSKNLFSAVSSLRMDARTVMMSTYLYSIATAFVGALPFTLLMSWLGGLPIWLGLIAPLLPIAMKSLIIAVIISLFNRTGTFTSPAELLRKATIPVGCALIFVGYIIPLAGWAPPRIITVTVMAAIVAAGALTFPVPLLMSTPSFYRLAKEFMASTRAEQAAVLGNSVQRTKSQKAIAELATEGTQTMDDKTRPHGLAYLNSLFMRRHRKILWRSALHYTAASAACVAVLIGVMLLFPTGLKGVSYAFSAIAFIMYFMNRGTGFTQALFMNCDHSLLTYPFFKQPAMILKLFVLRLKDIIAVNLPAALVIGIGFSILLSLENPSRSPLDYAIAFLATVFFSIFFSVHYMAMYYLIQPYNSSSEMKSALYGIVQAVTYMACYGLIQVQLPLVVLGSLSLTFCVSYCIIAGALVYRFAPTTFRLRT